jgi:predicted dehydrogenase
MGEEPEALRADAFGWTDSPRREAAVHVVARYSAGVLATLDASWLHPAKHRRLHCLGTEGLVAVDYLRQEVRLTRNNYELGDWGPLVGLTGASLGEQVRYSVQRKEPLRAEPEAFVAAVRGEVSPVTSGAEGLAVVRLLAGLVADLEPQAQASRDGAPF